MTAAGGRVIKVRGQVAGFAPRDKIPDLAPDESDEADSCSKSPVAAAGKEVDEHPALAREDRLQDGVDRSPRQVHVGPGHAGRPAAPSTPRPHYASDG